MQSKKNSCALERKKKFDEDKKAGKAGGGEGGEIERGKRKLQASAATQFSKCFIKQNEVMTKEVRH